MKNLKLLIITLLLTTLISCDFSFLIDRGESFTTTNIDSSTTEDKITFLWLTDVHLGKEKTHPDSFTSYEEQLFKWLEEGKKKYPFTLITGDLANSANDFNQAKAYITKLKLYCNGKVIYTIGNHEINKAPSNKPWLDCDFGDLAHSLYGRYTYNGVSIYKLDTALRTLGLTQLRALETALKDDTNDFKLFVAHIPISGSPIEATTLQMTIGTAEERNHIITLMKDNKVGVYLAGHHHKGNWEEHYNETTGEFIGSADHKNIMLNLDGTGYFYECTLDKANKTLTITPHIAADPKKTEKEVVFKLP